MTTKETQVQGDVPSTPAAGSDSLPERIRVAWKKGVGYHELMTAVFPKDKYPRAFIYQRSGGPPGCAMAFGKGLRIAGLRRSWDGRRIEGTPNAELSDSRLL